MAKRAIVQAWLDGLGHQPSDPLTERSPIPNAVMAHLAAVYDDHPEFDPEWLRPEHAEHPERPTPAGRPGPPVSDPVLPRADYTGTVLPYPPFGGGKRRR